MKTIILLKEETPNEMIDVYGGKGTTGAILNHISKEALWLAEFVGIIKTNGDAFVIKSRIVKPGTTIINFKASDILLNENIKDKLSDKPAKSTEAVAIEIF